MEDKKSKLYPIWKSSRAFLRPGDKVLMKDGEILTVKSLEFKEFVSTERVGYIPKSGIDCLLDPKQ